MGFKDRHLEDDYLEYLVVASRARIILGFVTVILLYALGPFALDWPYYDGMMWYDHLYRILSDEQKEDFNFKADGTWSKYFPTSTSTIYALLCLMLLMFILGGFVAYLHWTQ